METPITLTPKPKDFVPEPTFPAGHKWAGKPRCTAWSSRHARQCNAQPMGRKTKCSAHGGRSLAGIASPTLTAGGRYSKYIPAQLASKYDEARTDGDILSLNEDVALLRSFTFKYLSEMSAGDTHPAWIEAKKAYGEMSAAEAQGVAGIDKYMAARVKLANIIEPNYRAALAEGQVTRYIDQLGRIADKERRLILDRQQNITVERMMLLITAIAAVVKQHVDDRHKLNAIQNGIQGLLLTGS